jgi:hypothetical protein
MTNNKLGLQVGGGQTFTWGGTGPPIEPPLGGICRCSFFVTYCMHGEGGRAAWRLDWDTKLRISLISHSKMMDELRV